MLPGARLVRKILGANATSDRIGVFVDGPNVFRDEFDVDLDEVRAIVNENASIVVARVYLDEHATPGLVQAAEAHGFEVVVTSGDVDVKLAVDATEQVFSDSIDRLAIVSRDTDFKPFVEKANQAGIKTIAIAPGEHGRSDALRNAAHEAIVL
ncbi:MAG: hypothetical protein ACI9PP_001384 [Halobacteriales archaeon]|jgi:uncharacterized protein (TIGR00288 family)